MDNGWVLDLHEDIDFPVYSFLILGDTSRYLLCQILFDLLDGVQDVSVDLLS